MLRFFIKMQIAFFLGNFLLLFYVFNTLRRFLNIPTVQNMRIE